MYLIEEKKNYKNINKNIIDNNKKNKEITPQ